MDIDKIIYISLPKKQGHTNISDKTKNPVVSLFWKIEVARKIDS